MGTPSYVQQSASPWRLTAWLPGLLVATGAIGSFGLNGLVFIVVMLGLPPPAVFWRVLGGLVAVVLSGNWGTLQGSNVALATPQEAAAQALFFRTIIVGMLAAEVGAYATDRRP